jgi:hypothetical protein
VHGLLPIGGPARALVLFTPSAMEGYFEARLDELARGHRLEIVGPWPTVL